MRAEGGVPPLGPRAPHHKWGGGVSSPSSLCLAPGDPSWAVPGAHVGTRMHMGAGVRVQAGPADVRAAATVGGGASLVSIMDMQTRKAVDRTLSIMQP